MIENWVENKACKMVSRQEEHWEVEAIPFSKKVLWAVGFEPTTISLVLQNSCVLTATWAVHYKSAIEWNDCPVNFLSEEKVRHIVFHLLRSGDFRKFITHPKSPQSNPSDTRTLHHIEPPPSWWRRIFHRIVLQESMNCDNINCLEFVNNTFLHCLNGVYFNEWPQNDRVELTRVMSKVIKKFETTRLAISGQEERKKEAHGMAIASRVLQAAPSVAARWL